MEKIVIIGGNAAGLTAASRAKRQISYSTCGLPYFLANQVESGSLISYTPEAFEKERGIKVHSPVRVDAILPSKKRVEAIRADTGERVAFPFDRLLIATGVKPRLPDIPGTGLGNVHSLLNLQDALRLRQALGGAQRVAIVGAGYVGLELADCLHTLGKTITLFERAPHVLPSIDPDIARIIEYELRRWGIQVLVNADVLALTGSDGRVNGVKSASGLGVAPADLVVLDTGVEPNCGLARDAGIHIGAAGGIAVNPYMETNVPGIFAAGNCAETYCAIRRRPVFSAIGTVAAKQGRIAGENLAGRRAKFLGAIGTTVLKVFDLCVARTGLTLQEAAAERIPTVCSRIESGDRASYYPGARKVWIKLIVDRESRRLLGAHAAGYGDAVRRIDAAAAAIAAGMRIDEVAQLDLAYSPPYGSLWDPLLIAAQSVIREIEGR
jgi:NADPH-dependent 2,4-dienoyl-CoA reductase/sulfur reductase-like enzyme